MTLIDARSVAADPQSTARLSDAGLEYRVVDMADAVPAGAFARADARGFLDADPGEEQIGRMREGWQDRRNIGVYEPGAAPEAFPVATVNSWVVPLTVPGGEVPMWAISSVTVAATHRRRGIARNLLEGELRSAASAGVPIAGLTVSEATIYSRYGFAPAIPVARVAIDTRRAGWIGGATEGRLEYIDRETTAAELESVFERSRARRTGQIPGWKLRWLRKAGLAADDSKGAGVRGVRHVDADGETRGVLAYSLKEQSGTFRFTLAINHLVAETDEALRALWSFAVHHDLVTGIEGDLRPVDDPILHLVADQRAVEFTVHDHGWLRVLDVPAALAARRYRAPLDLVLRVDDALGFADGTWRLRVTASGEATVEATDAAAEVTMTVVELSAIYAGGVRATQLAAAGRIHGDPREIAAIDDAFRTTEAPTLGIWY
ncbi:GNAT family N-acetyltransferase [Microbacterium sp. NPDC057659]|uniref:GNAT family N-acetyltransferase n=1 Tax=Microbacterium sp. NPDC057659 TaxID=3346198 RepID=UPI00366BD68D